MTHYSTLGRQDVKHDHRGCVCTPFENISKQFQGCAKLIQIKYNH